MAVPRGVQALLAAAAAGSAILWAAARRGAGMDTHKLPNIVEAALPPHHRATVTWREGRFHNPWDTWQERSFSDVLKWNRERRKAGVPTDGWLIGNHSPSAADFAAAFPMEQVDFEALASPPSDAVQATWVGHSTLLVQLEGLTFITDPIFSERCSPVQWMGPKRVVPPAFAIDDPRLPTVHGVLLSHNHYDHLDKGSVLALNKRFGDSLRWYVSLGLASWFHRRGVRNVVELDWWQEATHPGSSVRVVLTPAQHWSMRTPWTRKASLWGSFAVLGQQRRFWFAGDTGMAPVFKEIGERLGPFDLAAIPIGAYEPRWFMAPQHIDPAEAVQIHKDVKARQSIACHLATFCLTDEALDEPAHLLVQEAAKAQLKPDEFVVVRHGATLRTAGGTMHNQPKRLPVVPPGSSGT